MAAPSYTTDLTTIDTADTTTGWAESSDGNWDDGGGPTNDTDTYIQGGATPASVSQTMTKSTICSLLYNNGAGITLPTDGAYLVWQMWLSPTALNTYANGGLRVVVGSSLGDFYSWDVGGSDFARNPYGGWHNHAVNTGVTADDTVGTPGATEQYVGAAANPSTGISKGNPHAVDALRYGRCESRFADGDLANGYCTFAGYAAVNDTLANRWGLLQAIPGGYLYKGLMVLGHSTAVDFRDSDVTIYIDNTPKVTANFNTIEVRQATSRVDWTRITFISLGTTSKGRFITTDNADLNWQGCAFQDMGTFSFLSGASILGCIFLRCAAITAAGPDMTGSSVLLSTVAADASALVWNVATDPDGYLDDMTFSEGANAHHAIEFGTSSPTSITLRGMTVTGFTATTGQNNSTFYVARTTGTVTINIVGGSGNFGYKSAGATVNIVIDPVTTTITVKDENDDDLQNARVLVEAADGTGDLPYEESVSITRSGSTATVTHTAHGLVSGDKVVIRDADQQEYNGVFTITVTGVNTYTYTVAGTPATPATGTITSTGVVLEGLTDVNGEITATRAFTVDQPVLGRVRKSTSSPLYKAVRFNDTVDNVNGLTKVVQMVRDD